VVQAGRAFAASGCGGSGVVAGHRPLGAGETGDDGRPAPSVPEAGNETRIVRGQTIAEHVRLSIERNGGREVAVQRGEGDRDGREPSRRVSSAQTTGGSVRDRTDRPARVGQRDRAGERERGSGKAEERSKAKPRAAQAKDVGKEKRAKQGKDGREKKADAKKQRERGGDKVRRTKSQGQKPTRGR